MCDVFREILIDTVDHKSALFPVHIDALFNVRVKIVFRDEFIYHHLREARSVHIRHLLADNHSVKYIISHYAVSYSHTGRYEL